MGTSFNLALNARHKHTQAHTHAHITPHHTQPHSHTHEQTHTHTHARKHTHTRTRTHRYTHWCEWGLKIMFHHCVFFCGMSIKPYHWTEANERVLLLVHRFLLFTSNSTGFGFCEEDLISIRFLLFILTYSYSYDGGKDDWKAHFVGMEIPPLNANKKNIMMLLLLSCYLANTHLVPKAIWPLRVVRLQSETQSSSALVLWINRGDKPEKVGWTGYERKALCSAEIR